MPLKCPNYGCPSEFRNARGLAEHDARWCKYKANSTRQHLAKRKAEIQAENDTKRARYKLDQQTRLQADNVSVSKVLESMYTFINLKVTVLGTKLDSARRRRLTISPAADGNRWALRALNLSLDIDVTLLRVLYFTDRG